MPSLAWLLPWCRGCMVVVGVVELGGGVVLESRVSCLPGAEFGALVSFDPSESTLDVSDGCGSSAGVARGDDGASVAMVVAPGVRSGLRSGGLTEPRRQCWAGGEASPGMQGWVSKPPEMPCRRYASRFSPPTVCYAPVDPRGGDRVGRGGTQGAPGRPAHARVNLHGHRSWAPTKAKRGEF